MKLKDVVSFRKDLLFHGAVQLGWFERNKYCLTSLLLTSSFTVQITTEPIQMLLKQALVLYCYFY